MTPIEAKARIKQAAEGFFDNAERERLGQRKRTKYIGSERSEQAKLAAWLDQHGILWLHPANERKASVQQHVSLKAQGVKAGAPDVLIFSLPPRRDTDSEVGPASRVGRGVAIELKRVSHRATVSVGQLEWLEALRQQGWLAKVCCGASEAVHWLTSLGFGAP
jgi:hypothetical protein